MAGVNNVAGSGMSSRLFQKIREELGLCYTIYSYPSCYLKTGTFAVYAGLNPRSAELAYEEIKRVLTEIKKNGITDDEFNRGKAQMISSFAFGQESTASQMLLDKNAVNELLDELDFSAYSVAVVGKNATKVEV